MKDKTLFDKDGNLSYLAEMDKFLNHYGKFVNPFGIDIENKDLIEGVFELFIDGNKDCRTEFRYGGYRAIFFPSLFKDIVIKIERFGNSIENAREWFNWQYIKDMEIAKFFAPVRFVSSNNKILVMNRAVNFKSSDLLIPDYEPVPKSFITNDCHMDNFGWIDKQLVCIDYSFSETLVHLNQPRVPWKEFVEFLTDKKDTKEERDKINKGLGVLSKKEDNQNKGNENIKPHVLDLTPKMFYSNNV